MLIWELLFENKSLSWEGNPAIGWWLDNPITIFYHGTLATQERIEGIMREGLNPPKSGPTAGFISLALEPNTAYGYASMAGAGGETEFRGSGDRARTTAPHERVVFKLKIPQNYFLKRMVPARGAMEEQRDRLEKPKMYRQWAESGKQDQEYYALTEIRLPDNVPSQYIVGYMFKHKPKGEVS